MIKVIFSRGASLPALASGSYITIKTPFYRIRSAVPIVIYPVLLGSVTGIPPFYYSVAEYKDGFILRVTLTTSASSGLCFIEWRLDGDFNFDNFLISDVGYDRRIEIRNENDVLIADNGLPWEDGTYPVDAKNRANLSGLHAAPAVINTELETTLMVDETNKERVQE